MLEFCFENFIINIEILICLIPFKFFLLFWNCSLDLLIEMREDIKKYNKDCYNCFSDYIHRSFFTIIILN